MEFLQSLDPRIVIVLASILFLWFFVKALRWAIKFALVTALIFVVIWKVPAVHDLFVGFIK